VKPKLKVISYRNLPVRLPFVGTAVGWLLLDRFHAPGWVWGIAATLCAIMWAVSIFLLVAEETVDIFLSDKTAERVSDQAVADARRLVENAATGKRPN